MNESQIVPLPQKGPSQEQMYEKEIKTPCWGEEAEGGQGGSFRFHFFMNTTLGTGYEIHLQCAEIADHVTLLSKFLFKL